MVTTPTTPTLRPARHLSTAACLALLVLSPPTLAQTRVPDNTRRPAAPPATQPTTEPADKPSPKPAAQPTPVVPAPKIEPRGAAGAIQLAGEPLRIESIGLSIFLPDRTRAESGRIGGRTSVTVLPEDQKYVLSIQTAETSNDQSTVEQALDKTVSLLQGAVGVLDPDQKTVLSTEARVIDRIDRLDIGGLPAGRLYVSIPEPDRASRVVKGYTIFKPQPKQFVIIELLCAEALFPEVRGVYETSVATAVFQDAESLMLDRMAAVKAGRALLTRITDADIDAILADGQEQWFRMYRPSPTGGADDEVGYYGVRFWRGVRGEIDPSRKPAAFTPADQQQGLLVRVRSRVLNGTTIGDNEGIFFVTDDRREEAWSVRTAARETTGKQRAVATETGARLADDLTIIKQEPGKPTQTLKPAILNDGYISQFDTFFLPRVMGRLAIPGEYGFYAYESWPSGAITFRKDVVAASRVTDGTMTTVTSTLRQDSAPQVSTFAPGGRLLLTKIEDGSLIREPIDLPSLRQIWQSKGLPTER